MTAASRRADPPPARFLVGTSAHNSHVQHMVRALYDADALDTYVTGGVDIWRNPVLRVVRQAIGAAMPGVSRQLNRRAVSEVPAALVRPRWRWETLRLLALGLGGGAELEDWLWERGEFDLDRLCARLVGDRRVRGFFGVEHGALAALRAAHALAKPAVVAFLSPHHATRAKWVDAEFDRFPELRTAAYAYVAKQAAGRAVRLDEEAAIADWIVTGSSFTTRSLVDAGIHANKILTVPLGGPPPVSADALPRTMPSVFTYVYVGPVSVRKGAHYLLQAWRTIARPGVELHFYGKQLLPSRLLQEAQAARGGDAIFFHGSIPASELRDVYLRSSVLVLPTLCDGFGMVVSEALAHGLPVITTTNAGAADRVQPMKTGFVIEPADAAALATCLAWCADNPAAVFDMRRPALASAAEWTWADFRRQFIAKLQGALATVRPSALAAVGR